MTENRCIEVLKKMKHMFTETCAKIDENNALDMAVEAIRENQQYKAIGTIEEFKALKEKSVAKKPYSDQKGLIDAKMWHCPVCKKEVISDWNRDLANDYCHNCGQKLDWQ